MLCLGRLVPVAISYSVLVFLVTRLFTLVSRLYISRLQRKTKPVRFAGIPTITPAQNIRPLHGFDYTAIEPIKYRPFETKRHVSMGTFAATACLGANLYSRPVGIKKSNKEDWIRIDRGYLNRMKLRQSLLDNTPEVCLGTSKLSDPAIRELYEEIILELLPKRYPTMFKRKGDMFYNAVTGSRHRISEALSDCPAMLRHVAENVEEDFWFMVPNEEGEFILQGFAACFPQGLLPMTKVGMSVSEIHAPIPGYEGRLKKGVNRCFERMERGQSVGRLNVCSSPTASRSESTDVTSGQYNAITPNFTYHTMAPTPSKTQKVHANIRRSIRYPHICALNIIH